MDLSPKYDAYFFLQTGNMDPASTYFRDKDYFKSLVSTEIFNAIEDKFGGVTVWQILKNNYMQKSNLSSLKKELTTLAARG